jgi:RNA polymerase sigma-70 factor (ECF subfamily)
LSLSKQERKFLFEEFVLRYTNLLFYVANGWCANATDAEELVQEAFLKAYHKFDTFRLGSNFKAWILKILRNLYLDKKRKRQIHSIPLEQEMAQDLEDSTSALEVVHLESKEIFYDLFSDEIVRLLEKMPKDYQLCLLLCDVEELNYQEIADILGCPIGTVRSRIHRGRMLFQKEIKEYAKNIGYLKEPNS